MRSECSVFAEYAQRRPSGQQTVVLRVFFYGIYPVEGIGVFRVPKNGDARNKKPPALRVETKRCTKKSPFRYNRVVESLLQERKGVLWRISLMISPIQNGCVNTILYLLLSIDEKLYTINTYVGKYSTQTERILVHVLPKRKIDPYDLRQTCKSEV